MSYRSGNKASTPIHKTVVLPNRIRAGYSKSISPIVSTSKQLSVSGGRSLSRERERRKGRKRQESASPVRRKFKRIAYEQPNIDITRDAPPPITDIRSIIDEPLYPRPQFVPPKVFTGRVDGDVEYVQVPELETTSNDQENIEDITDSGESEEYHVRTPVKTYKGSVPRNWKRNWNDSADWMYSMKKDIPPVSALPNLEWYPNREAERLWVKYCAKDAEVFAKSQRAAPHKKAIRNREIMLRIRENATVDKRGAVPNKTKEQPLKKKTREPERSLSPEMITMRGKLSEYPKYTTIDEIDPFDSS